MIIKILSFIELDLKTTSLVTLRYAIRSITGLILSILFARLASKETFGAYQFILSLLSLISVISLPGLAQACIKSVADGNSRGLAQSVYFSFKLSWLGSIFLVLYSLKIFHSGNYNLGQLVLMSAAGFPFLYGANSWYAFYYGNKKFHSVETKTTFSSLFIFAILSIGLFLKFSVMWLLFSYILGTSAFSWIYFFQAKKKYGIKGSGVIPTKYAISITIQKFIVGLSENLPIFIIGIWFGFKETASYQLAYLPLSMAAGYLSGLFNIKLPFMNDNTRIEVFSTLLQNLAIGFIIYGGLTFFLYFFFLPIYGKEYNEALFLAWRLSFLTFLFPLKTHLTNLLSMANKNLHIVYSHIFANSLTLLLSFFLFKTFAFTNAVCCYIYTLNISTVALLLVYCHLHNKNFISIK
jgi:O-antigen/teichoic acid export membrane protein